MDSDINKNLGSSNVVESSEAGSSPGNDIGDEPTNGESQLTPKTNTPSGIPVYSSQSLFGSANEIGIEHDNFFYRLRITRQGKLILTK